MIKQEQWDAIVACDGQYDGRFFYGVMTTGIFCRPSCKSRTPKKENVRIFTSTDEALAADLRPCKRCRPEEQAWRGSNEELVERAKGIIARCYQEELGLNEVANRLFVSPFHLHRSFRKIAGVTPAQFLSEQRLAAAKRLLTDTELSVTQIAFAVGYQSAAHFSTFFRKETGQAPSQYKKTPTSG
ncbi:MAG: bifunctional transcriptional activator/DNA repair enzyme AdaA [Tumebacillaceae bacterium]